MPGLSVIRPKGSTAGPLVSLSLVQSSRDGFDWLLPRAEETSGKARSL